MRTLDMLVSVKRKCRKRLNGRGLKECSSCPCCVHREHEPHTSCLWDCCPRNWEPGRVEGIRKAGFITRKEADAALRVRHQCLRYLSCTECPHWSMEIYDCVLNSPPAMWYTRKSNGKWAPEGLWALRDKFYADNGVYDDKQGDL